MKNIYKYFVILALGGSSLLTGCDSFLTTIPESSYSAAGSYQTQADFNFAIAAVYASQQGLYNTNASWHRLIITRSDDIRTGATYTNGVDQFTDTDAVDHLTTFWSTAWQMISRCNMILDKIDAIDFPDAALKNSIKGEAYALRAWTYYNLGWQFGGVPLIDRELTVPETLQMRRSTQEQTFEFAANDYKKAIELLPASWTEDNMGRITKYAAEGGLARMLMFQSKFSEAKPYLADIINSGLYAMEEKYVNCFTDSHDNGKERVWEIQFTGNLQGEGQDFAAGMVPESYPGGDFFPFGGWSSYIYVSNSMVKAYEEGDLRKDVSVITNIMNDGVIDTKYFVRKFCHFEAYSPQNKSDMANNIPVIRYTDIKMMYAECLNEEGYEANGEALNIINQVRSRAGLPNLTALSVPNQDAFRKAIMQERRVEFAFEGLRWPDLVRWGIAKDVMNTFLLDKDEGNGLYFMEDFRNIFAIPHVEIERYNNKDIMWQNPGY